MPRPRHDYLPDSRILRPADKAERAALLKAFGARLKRARLRAGLTQRELAERAEFSNPAFASQLERGARPPNLVHLAMLTHALGVSYETLLADLPAPLREQSAREMIAVVRREPGISADLLATQLHVKPRYILMLGARLCRDGRLRRDRDRFWSADGAKEDTEST
jgi:transcriptional regulator with XRE-family HTH domain